MNIGEQRRIIEVEPEPILFPAEPEPVPEPAPQPVPDKQPERVPAR